MPDSCRRNRGFSLVETLVTVAILAVLVAIVVPAARSYRARAEEIRCCGNLRTIGTATLLYASDNGMRLPVTSHQRRKGGKSWLLTLQPYAGENLVSFRCPGEDDEKRAYTYLINDFLTPNPPGASDLDYSYLNRLDRPDETILFAEAAPSGTPVDHFHFSIYRGGQVPASVFKSQVDVETHGGKANYVFADGHVETLPWTEVRSRLARESSRLVDPTIR